MARRDVFAQYGVQYDGKHIWCDPLAKWIPLLLINGNKKIGRGVWHFSTTAGNAPVSTETVMKALGPIAVQYMESGQDLQFMCGGTCSCNCPGCYAQSGHYAKASVKASLAWRTFLARRFEAWTENAINAQIAAFGIKMVRIHAAGDFFSDAYCRMWTRIAAANPDTIFWTYTKTLFKAVAEFDAMPNCNVVKSLVNGGFNFGKAGYLIALHYELVKAGKSVWICRCGIDKNQHCNNCHHCYSAEYVLFLEHGTD